MTAAMLRRGGDLLILCYHAVSDSWPDPAAVGVDSLERQVRHLLRRRYRPSTLSAALKADPGERLLVVTFDDAFASVAERGLPVLERLGVPATLFVPTDFVDERGPLTWSKLGRWVGTTHEDELRCMTWKEVRRLAERGWEIGSHTCSHPDLTTIGHVQATAELNRSKQVCEAETGHACRSLAYPFGRCEADVVELARSAGYEVAVTLGKRLLGPRTRDRRLELSREGIYRSTGWPFFLAATSISLGKVRQARPYRSLRPSRPDFPS